MVDLVGNRRLRDLRRAVAPGGRLVLSGGGNPGEGVHLGPVWLMAKGSLFGRLMGLQVQVPLAAPDGARLTELAGWRRAARSAASSSAPTPSPTAAAAIRHLEVEHARGKVVVTV